MDNSEWSIQQEFSIIKNQLVELVNSLSRLQESVDKLASVSPKTDSGMYNFMNELDNFLQHNSKKYWILDGNSRVVSYIRETTEFPIRGDRLVELFRKINKRIFVNFGKELEGSYFYLDEAGKQRMKFYWEGDLNNECLLIQVESVLENPEIKYDIPKWKKKGISFKGKKFSDLSKTELLELESHFTWAASDSKSKNEPWEYNSELAELAKTWASKKEFYNKPEGLL